MKIRRRDTATEDERDGHRSDPALTATEREALRQEILSSPDAREAFKSALRSQRNADSFEARCFICGSGGVFVRNAPSLREGYRCTSCGSSLRYQGQADALLRRYATKGASSIAELVSDSAFARLHIWEPGVYGPFRPYLRALPNYNTSYYWPDVAPGEVRDGLRCEDLMALTFRSESFDLVITSDIFEHVRRPYVGFAEVHRALRTGGTHVFSIPVQEPMPTKTVPRVDTSADEDVYLLEPRYHRGPNDTEHIVYNNFGADLVDRLRDVGFETEVMSFPSTNAEAARLLTFCSVKE
jgi:SAM-dependent methyltransferase